MFDSFRRRRGSAGLVALASALVLSGCSPRKTVNWIFGPNLVTESLDPAYSYNILAVPWWWPDEDTFDIHTPPGRAQKAYYKEHGPPEHLRLLYNTEGILLRPGVVSQVHGAPPPRGVAWIYLDRKIEVTFSAKNGTEEKPLNDEVATVCEHGDPDEIKDLTKDPKTRVVRFIYRGGGKMFDFQDFKKTKEETIGALPGWKRSSN